METRIERTPSGIWSASYRHGASAGGCGFHTKAEARQWLRDQRDRLTGHPETSVLCAERALHLLRQARDLLVRCNAKRAAQRVRLAITSCGGAVRHARLAEYRNRRREAREGGAA